MDRRAFVRNSLAGLASIAGITHQEAFPRSEQAADLGVPAGAAGRRLFPADVPTRVCRKFPAEGFANPACGIIYRKRNRPVEGMPLGGLDTGRLDIQANGTFGYCTIFNSICPQRGPLDMPFLGMAVEDQVWVLADPPGTYGEYTHVYGVLTPPEIHYWGHYPVLDIEFEMPGSPVSVGLRSWAVFLPGDRAASNTPGAVFEVHLRNLTDRRQTGRLAFAFPGPTQEEAQISEHSPRERVIIKPGWPAWIPTCTEKVRALRQVVRGEFSGVVVTAEKAGAPAPAKQPGDLSTGAGTPEMANGTGYALGVIGDHEVHAGGGMEVVDRPYSTGAAWKRIGTELPSPGATDFSGSLAVDFEIDPHEDKTVRFVLAWFAPMWIGEETHTFTHMYTTRYQGALDVAQFLSRQHASLLRRTLGWQDVIYGAGNLPIWLRESLVNILYLFAVNSLWAAARPPIGPWCRPEDGLFGLLDGIVEDPAIEPIPDSFYANAPLVYFFPELALSSLRGYKAYQFADGRAVWIWGGCVGAAIGGYEPTAGTEFAMPTPGYQTTTNGPCYVDLVDRVLQRTGNRSVLEEFYPSTKKNTIYTMGLHPEDGGDGIISVPAGDIDPMNPSVEPGRHLEWFEHFLWFGMTSHVGGIHLANLKMSQRLAEQVGDAEFVRQCRRWFELGSQSLETKLWNGTYYLTYSEPAKGKRSDDVFACQLDGEWMARFHGLRDVFRPDRVKTTLHTIKRACIDPWPYGAVNFARPDGALSMGVGYGPTSFFVPELYMLGAMYLYEGEQEIGLELVRRLVYSLNNLNLLTWNQPNTVRADTGDRLCGSHYDQNMILWAVPAALERKDIASFCAPGGLVDKVIKAATAS